MPGDKRILLVSHEMTYTGAPNSLLNMARLLRNKGWKITIQTLNCGNFSREFSKHGFCVRWLDGRLSAKELKDIADQYDLVICNTVFCAKIACALQNYVKTILLVREAENLPEIMADNHIDEGWLRNAEYIVCVSEYAEKYLYENYQPKHLWVLHNFMMASKMHRPGENKVHKGKVHFLIAATIEKRKGIDIAIEAIKILPQSISEQLVLDIAGRKPSWSQSFWEGLIPENDARFQYHGEVTRGKKRLFQRSNVILVPSLDEACSLTALEGGMYGKPLIVTENVGAKYMVEGSGFVVKTGSAAELARAMEFFVINKETLDIAGKICFRQFKKTSTKEIYFKNISAIISEVLDE